MSFTHTLTRIYRDSSGTNLTQVDNVVSDSERNIDYQLAGSATNKEITIALTVADLQSCAFSVDQACTVYTNAASTGTPQDTIALLASQVYVWDRVTDGAGKIPFSGNITAFYITVPGSTVCNFKFRSLSTYNV